MRTVILTVLALLAVACGDPVVPVCGGPPIPPAPRGGAVTAAPPADMAPPDMQAPDAR